MTSEQLHNTSMPSLAFAKYFVRAMRKNGVTIREYASFCQISQTRIREIRKTGVCKHQGEWLLNLRDLVVQRGGPPVF